MNNSIHCAQPFDKTIPLENEAREKFCQEYLRLDLDGEIKQAKARRIEAFRVAYPEYRDKIPSDANMKAVRLLRDDNVAERLAYLYEQSGTGIENEIKWTKSKSEDMLLEIIYSTTTKDSDKLKAIQMINELREIGPADKEEEQSAIDSVKEFFSKLKV